MPSVLSWMGEASGGKSATCPTFLRSTSVRTRMLLQYSQTVCTLLDQRKTIFAPQLGQLAAGCVIAEFSLTRRRGILSQSPAACFHFSSYGRCKRRIETDSAANRSFRANSKSHSPRGTQQKRFRHSEPCSGNVWQAR